MFDRDALARLIALHGRVVRVVIARVEGSSPREPGCAMLIWQEGETWGQEGTIGGGALEYMASARALAMLREGPDLRLDREALGPGLGQCCGGAVTLVCEIYDAARLAATSGRSLWIRRVTKAAPEAQEGADLPFALQKLLARQRAGAPEKDGSATLPLLVSGWLAEPCLRPRRPLWIWGAGHVGRAVSASVAALPDFAVTQIDTEAARFPDPMPEGVVQLISPAPASLCPWAPRDAFHLILSYSHALDLELCHRLLQRGFAKAGLIGSVSKKARFQARLRALGHETGEISRITCPIGAPDLGKHPQAIALGVAVQLLNWERQSGTERADGGTGQHASSA